MLTRTAFAYNATMFRLTREVRFALNDRPDDQLAQKPSNSFGGYPSLTGFGKYYALHLTLEGQLDQHSSYLRNIKEIDDVVRKQAIARFAEFRTPFEAPAKLLTLLKGAFPGVALAEVDLALSPFLHVRCLASEFPMTRLSQKFEFSASHRLHNPGLSDDENCRLFGKCNNPHGHGHNYEVQVTLHGQADANGLLVDIPAFERTVASTVIDRLDHKNLNVEVAEFRDLIPSVENIAMVIYRLLKPRFANERSQLASVTVWETAKTSCEYSE